MTRYHQVREAAEHMDVELKRTLIEAGELISLDELPAVYQVHQLQPLLQNKLDHVIGGLLSNYQHLKNRFSDALEKEERLGPIPTDSY